MKQILLEYLESQFKPDMTADELHKLARSVVEAEYLSDEDCKTIIEKEFPFLVDKQALHDKVEKVIVNRLTTSLPTDIEVSDMEYSNLMCQIEDLITSTAKHRLVHGFTSEDLESFLVMKVYQVMKRGQYDPTKPAKPYFARVFRNLINDINRCKDRALKSCDDDALYDALSIDTAPGQPFLNEA